MESPAAQRQRAPVLSITDAALRVAALAVFERSAEWSADALDQEEGGRQLAAIAHALETGKLDDLDAGVSPAVTALRRRLLELLHSELITCWNRAEPAPSAAEVLAWLNSFERLRVHLTPAWHQRFGSRLTGPDSLDLVVEVAHDLRSPLTSIMLLSETLRRGQSGEVNERQHSQLGIIYSAALALISMASDVIELARGGEALVDHEPVPFSLTEVLQSVRDMVQPMAEEKGVQLRIQVSDTDRRLGHPIPISRILLNLTTNALKFSEEGAVEVGVRELSRQRVEFYVRDEGRGIPAEVLEFLYEPFRRRSVGNGYHFSGTGLGLSICRKLVEALGSRLELESRDGWGSRFAFELDLKPADRF
jgi:signal transduction histidine kinase